MTFEKGIPASVNGQKMKVSDIIRELNRLGGKHGIGIVDIVENRVVGMKKSRIICGIVVLSMLASYLFSILPGVREISEGFKIIILTVAIAGFAAWKFPVREEAEGKAEEKEK